MATDVSLLRTRSVASAATERLDLATHHLAEVIMNATIAEKLKDKRVREVE